MALFRHAIPLVAPIAIVVTVVVVVVNIAADAAAAAEEKAAVAAFICFPILSELLDRAQTCGVCMCV